MPILSARSKHNLSQCHPDIQRVFAKVAETEPIEVICGHRNKADQDRAYQERRSKLRWPKSRHNSSPSQAVDVCPRPIDWADVAAFKRLAAHVKEIAGLMGVPLDWGGDWDAFVDMPHWEMASTH